MSFKKLGLRAELVKAVEDLGFESPTLIQEKSIPVLLSGDLDFMGLAQTGSGKTGAFGLPLIQNIDLTLSGLQGIVMCPTRELCLQITNDLKAFAKHLKKVAIVAVYGGASISNQIRQLKKGPQIVVATPGRLLDFINRKVIKLSRISYAVLDEADEMLNMGFQEDINSILAKMPEDRKVWMFYATMPKGVAHIARNYMTDPVKVKVGKQNRSPETITHISYIIQEKYRYQGVKRIIDFTPEIFALVFCRTRKETQAVAENLIQDGYQAEALHGDLSQAQRDYVMRKFRHKTIRILVATDVAARGLDVEDISHVIHYNLPDDSEIYTHRSGRTARAGKSGISIALINAREKYRLRKQEKSIKIKFESGKLPDGRDICKKQLFDLVEKIIHTDVNQDRITDYLPDVYNAFSGLDKEELIQRFVSAQFNRFFEYYCHAGDINAKISPETSAPSKKVKRKAGLKQKKTQRFFINVGRLDKINEGAIVRLVCDKSGIGSNKIGDIDLKREFSFFEVEKKAAKKVLKSMNKVKLDGRLVHVQEVFNEKKQGKGELCIS
ncbi:MAG: DEAD/DEAH box helicase [Deltaproteobacteria bacterium]|nr:DEAD/DEAH box helicase [Deltaproteobacteria bacterium]